MSDTEISELLDVFERMPKKEIDYLREQAYQKRKELLEQFGNKIRKYVTSRNLFSNKVRQIAESLLFSIKVTTSRNKVSICFVKLVFHHKQKKIEQQIMPLCPSSTSKGTIHFLLVTGGEGVVNEAYAITSHVFDRIEQRLEDAPVLFTDKSIFLFNALLHKVVNTEDEVGGNVIAFIEEGALLGTALKLDELLKGEESFNKIMKEFPRGTRCGTLYFFKTFISNEMMSPRQKKLKEKCKRENPTIICV